MIIIYGKPGCVYCDKAKDFCKLKNFNYEYKELDRDYRREELLESYPEARTLPLIFANGVKIGGYNDFVDYIDQTGYNGTGYTL